MNIRLEQLAPNFTRVEVGDVTIWFSYEIPIALRGFLGGTIIRRNVWGTTTGRHLNVIDRDHSKRLSSEEFEVLLAAALKERD